MEMSILGNLIKKGILYLVQKGVLREKKVTGRVVKQNNIVKKKLRP